MLRLKLDNGAVVELDTGDITRETSEAIVNAANSSLMGGGGVDGAIHHAGGPDIVSECRRLRKMHYPHGLPPGQAVATSGGRLPAKHVIHTVGPIWHGGNHDEAATLANCYGASLRVAHELGVSSVSFPSISTGAFGYPMNDAAQIAIAATLDCLREAGTVRKVRLVLFDQHAYAAHARVARELGQARGWEIEETGYEPGEKFIRIS